MGQQLQRVMGPTALQTEHLASQELIQSFVAVWSPEEAELMVRELPR